MRIDTNRVENNVKTTILMNSNLALSKNGFKMKLKKKLMNMNKEYIVISYHLKEDDYNHIIGAVIRYKKRDE